MSDYPEWKDATKESPTSFGPYLVILNSNSAENHNKDFAGRGIPEVAVWTRYASYEGGPITDRWHARGSLKVAYWIPLPPFDKTWVKNDNGTPAEWV